MPDVRAVGVVASHEEATNLVEADDPMDHVPAPPPAASPAGTR